MHKSILDATIASVRIRDAQGDCPTEPPFSVEHLEGALLSLVLETRYGEAARGVEDAQLAAAAPDLLDALKRIVDPAPGVSQKAPAWVYGIAKAAIKNAEGSA